MTCARLVLDSSERAKVTLSLPEDIRGLGFRLESFA
jgi:hypothetical protein